MHVRTTTDSPMNEFPQQLILMYGSMAFRVAFRVGLPLGFLYLAIRAVRVLERRGKGLSEIEALAARVQLLEERVATVEGSAARVPKR